MIETRDKLIDLFADEKCPHWFRDNQDMMHLANYLVQNGVTLLDKKTKVCNYSVKSCDRIEELKAKCEGLCKENAELSLRLENAVHITHCKDCRYSVTFKGRLLCTRDAKIQDNGDIWGATAVEADNFCKYGS